MNLGAVLILIGAALQSGTEDPCVELLTQVAKQDWHATARGVLDAGPSCVAPLVRRLASRDDSRYSAAYALALMGDASAQDALYESLRRRRDSRIKAYAAVGAAVVQRSKDVVFLCGALHGDHHSPGWEPIEAAALSLGLIRSRACHATLRRVAAVEDSIAGEAARHALTVMAAKPACRAASDVGDEDAAVAAVMDCAVPGLDASSTFYEESRHRIWYRAGGTWLARPAAGDDVAALPKITLSTVAGRGRSRALVSVGMMFGPMNGHGYDYFLARNGQEWRVIAIQSTWIS